MPNAHLCKKFLKPLIFLLISSGRLFQRFGKSDFSV